MKDANNKGGKSVLGAAVLGAVVGAASVALAHKPTRKMLKQKLAEAMDRGDEAMDKAGQKVEQIKKTTRKAAARELKKAQEKLDNGASRSRI